MGIFNREKKEIKTVKDFADADEKEKQEALKELDKIKQPQLNFNHKLDWELTNGSFNNGNDLQSENDQNFPY